MRIAVTGATGFIGRHVVAEALRLGHDVVAVGRDRAQFDEMPWRDQASFCAFNFYQPEAEIFTLFGKPEICIHLAWGGLQDFNALSHCEVELPAQFAFLNRLVSGGLPRLLVTGTCLEYGMQSGCLAEGLPTSPVTPYGLAKDTLRRELEFLQRMTGFSSAWARLFYIYGEAPGRRTLFMQLKAAVERDDPAFSMSHGEQLRDYLPVETVGERLVALALAKQGDGVFNVCSGKPISVRRLVENWCAANNWTIRLDLGRYECPEYEPLAFWGDSRRFDAIRSTQ